MNSLNPGKASGRRLILMLVGVALSANGALAAEPVSDSQELARQFILGKSVSGFEADSNTKLPQSTSASSTVRVDPQEYVRQFILGTPNVEFVADSSEHVTGFAPAPGSAHVDPQEQVRQFILGTPKLGDPSAGTAATSAESARSHRRVDLKPGLSGA
jgi:hypothetical protein